MIIWSLCSRQAWIGTAAPGAAADRGNGVSLPGCEVPAVAAAAELGCSAWEAVLAKTKPDSSEASDPFHQLYPNVAEWVHDGWIELGRDDVNRSFIRVLDIGGLIWESDKYTTAHQALAAADKAIARYLAKLG